MKIGFNYDKIHLSHHPFFHFNLNNCFEKLEKEQCCFINIKI